MDAKEVSESIQRHMSLATYWMAALGNVATKSKSFFVEARFSSVAFAWSVPIYVSAVKTGLSIARA